MTGLRKAGLGHTQGTVTPGQRPMGDVRAPPRDAAPWRSAALTARGPVAVTGPGTCTGGLPAWAWGLPQHPGPSLLRAAPRLLGAASAVGSGRCQTRPAQHRGPLQPHTASQNIVTEKLNGRTVRLSRSTPSCLRGGERERPHTRPRPPHVPATPAHAPTAPAHMAPRPPRCHSRSRKGDAARVCADGRTGDQNAVHTCNGGRSSHRRHGPPTRAATGTDPDSVRPSETSQTRTARFHSHEVTDQNRQRQGRGAGAWWGPCCSGGTKVSDAAMMTPQHQEHSEGRLEVADSMLHIF